MAQQPNYPRRPYSGEALISISRGTLIRLVIVGVGLFVLAIFGFSGTYTVHPATPGIRVTLGNASAKFLAAGFGVKAPFVAGIVPMNVRQRTKGVNADCFSSDLQ